MELDSTTPNSDSASNSLASSVASDSSSYADDGSEQLDGNLNDGLRSKSEGEKPLVGQRISNTCRWKVFVIVLMLVNLTLAIVATRIFLNNQADLENDRSFQTAAETVSDSIHDRAKALTDSLTVLGDIVTSYAMDTNSEWPFITLPRFEDRIASVRKSSTLEVLGLSPVVHTMQREEWEAYSLQEQGWIRESYLTTLQESPINAENSNETMTSADISTLNFSISPTISISAGDEFITHPTKGPYVPIWQMSPPPPTSESAVVNSDLLSMEAFQHSLGSFLEHDVESISADFVISPLLPLSIYNTQVSPLSKESVPGVKTAKLNSASSILLHPIHESSEHDGSIKGFAMGIFDWTDLFSGLLPDHINGIVLVLVNPCARNESHTFGLHAGEATYKGVGDLHEMGIDMDDKSIETVLTEFDAFVRTGTTSSANEPTQQCNFVVHIYSSAEFRTQTESKAPLIFIIVIAAVFIGTGLIFLVYVFLVSNRQSEVMAIAQSANAVVASLFPASVRDEILKNAEEEVNKRASQRREAKRSISRRGNRKAREKKDKLSKQDAPTRSKPIADKYPEASVLFADIVGFTAWSSAREPTQVFELLETIYHNFDGIAKRRGVFKVETIGDCYVAVCGLPEPDEKHAVTMCRFARDCLQAMEILTRKLESTLGPDTGELSMRFGIHSGAVTAGVLRGDRARFQLFGDTVNTAARMESNGAREKIHISEQTVSFLAADGKEDWYIPREDKILAKGKGELQTYWLHTKKSSRPMSDVSLNDGSLDIGGWLDLPTELFNSNSNLCFSSNKIRECLSEQNQRLADWNSNQLLLLLDTVVAHRQATGGGNRNDSDDDPELQSLGGEHTGVDEDISIIKKIKDKITMPSYNSEVFVKALDTPTNLSEVVQQQLHDYVSIICSMYVDNPFHSYQHASHVTMSLIKYITSLAAPHQYSLKPEKTKDAEHERARHHEKTFGISSDPISHFALAFAALIHDVDHPGVSNAQLGKENTRLARIFEGRCITEQNSFQCAWDLLMDPSFDYLRNAIYSTKEEFFHFRDLLINAVLATDMFDKDLNESRQRRWKLAFSEDSSARALEIAPSQAEKELSDLRATVVLEYVIQASDVAHMMQHWAVYRKWNDRLFHENLLSYWAGRLDKDPSSFWFEQELKFFDEKAIPMARKLKECGAFGLFFDEYLDYAVQNREEWERKGKEIVAEMANKFDGTETKDLLGESGTEQNVEVS